MEKERAWWVMQHAYKLLTQNMKESSHLEDQDIDGIMA
jgi:hypothetical protein